MRTGGIWLGRPREEYDEDLEEIAGLLPITSPEGDATIFQVDLSGGQRLNVSVPYENINALSTVVRQAQAQMTNRQRFKIDRGAEAILAIADSAQRVESFDMFTDPTNGDWIFLYQFAHNAPFAVRVDPIRALDNMKVTWDLIRAAAH